LQTAHLPGKGSEENPVRRGNAESSGKQDENLAGVVMA
jgi:hypothetical protein